MSESESVPENLHQYLTFFIGGERFALPILDVKEIIEVSALTRVPMTPNFIRGVINLRGNVVPVIDLSARLGRQASQINKRSCIVLVELEAEEETHALGMLVDEVNEILDILPGHIQPPPDFGTDIRTEFILNMGQVGDEFLILLNINKVLSIKELSELQALNPSMLETPTI